MARPPQLTMLLNQWRTGDSELIDEIIPAVYEELHRVARNYMRGQPQEHTLQATALINEAFCRLGDVKSELQDRGHFIGIVARLMRNVLVDHARAKNAEKRGGGAEKIPLEESDANCPPASVDVLALESVLSALAERDPRRVQVAELYYFCGMTCEETAAALGISEATVTRELRMLKAVLAHKLAAN